MIQTIQIAVKMWNQPKMNHNHNQISKMFKKTLHCLQSIRCLHPAGIINTSNISNRHITTPKPTKIVEVPLHQNDRFITKHVLYVEKEPINERCSIIISRCLRKNHTCVEYVFKDLPINMKGINNLHIRDIKYKDNRFTRTYDTNRYNELVHDKAFYGSIIGNYIFIHQNFKQKLF